MSADNGIVIIKKEDDEYEVRYYNASTEYVKDEDMTLLETCTTLEDAIIVGQDQATEYGLHFVGL